MNIKVIIRKQLNSRTLHVQSVKFYIQMIIIWQVKNYV